MKGFSYAVAGTVLVVALTGCSAPSDAPSLDKPTSSLSVTPSPTPSATPTPEAAAGTRANPLQPGQSRKIADGSAWSVGSSAATARGDGYIVFPLQVAIDWDAAREQAKATAPDWSPENEGLDPYGSLTVEFVSAAGRSYRTMDNYDVAISDQFYSLGTVYPPATTFNANVAVSVPTDQVDGGTWVIKNPRGDSVFVAVG